LAIASPNAPIAAPICPLDGSRTSLTVQPLRRSAADTVEAEAWQAGSGGKD